MSDHSSGSSGSSTNSWTILSPEEAAVETLGPDDGTESLCGVPGLPEEGTAGVPMEVDVAETVAPAEPVLSEEGHQVCQETSPEVCEAAAFIRPSFSGHEEGDFDPEIHAPVIHDTITSSPPDSDLLGSTPFPITSESALLFSEEPTFVQPASKMFTDVSYSHEIPAEELLPQESRSTEVLPEERGLTPEVIPEPDHTTNASRQIPRSEDLPSEVPSDSGVATEASAPETLFPESSPPEVPPERSPTLDAPFVETLTQESPFSEPLPAERTPTPEPVPAEVTPDVSSVAPDTPAPVEEESAPVAVDPSQYLQGHPPSDSTVTPEASPAAVGPEPETISTAPVQPLEEEPEQQEEEPEQKEEESEQHEEELEQEVEEQEQEVEEGEVEPALERGEEADDVEKQDEETVEAVPVEEVVRPCAEGDGLRHRHVLPPEPQRGRSSEDEDEEEEEEFQLAERREEKQGFALNKLIVGALVLLCLGSLFFSDDGFDGSEVTEQELLERLAQENQQIAMLEAQLQSQKEVLDRALRAAVEQESSGGGPLQKENVRLKEELAAMPGLKDELESLRARVAELSQLTVQESETKPSATNTVTPPTDQPESEKVVAERPEAAGKDGLKIELQRQKSLLENSRKRLEVMKKSAGKKKGVREGLVEMQKRLSEQAERLDKRHDWKRKQQQQQRDNEAKKDQDKKWAGKKEQGNQWRGKKEEKEQWEEGSHKHSSQWEAKKEHNDHNSGKKEHGVKWEETKDHGKHKHHDASEKRKEQKEGKNGKNGKDGKESKQHTWRKYHEDWDGRKHERKMEREKRKSERPWEAKFFKKTSSHHDHDHDHHRHHHHHHQEVRSHERSGEHKHTHVDFWKHQEQKLRRNPGPTRACSGVTQCAEAEGLVAVELTEFQALLESYLSKLPASTGESKDELQRLTDDFFPDGLFDHERLLFSDFAEDVADILEDLADVLDNESLEEEMEEFEREALWKFAAAA